MGKRGSYLRADFRETCPDGFGFNFVRSWAFPFLLVYPIGIPVGFMALLYFFQVPKMAAQKRKHARLQALYTLHPTL